MPTNTVTAPTDRVKERRRAVALAHHYREFQGLSIAQIAERLGRSPATIKAYFYDPSAEKARVVKARYQGVCRGCGSATQPRNGKGDAYRYCKRCHPGATQVYWTRQRVLAAIRECASDTASCPPPTTGRGRALAYATVRRSSDSPGGNGRQPASSPTAS